MSDCLMGLKLATFAFDCLTLSTAHFLMLMELSIFSISACLSTPFFVVVVSSLMAVVMISSSSLSSSVVVVEAPVLVVVASALVVASV